jgi:hypothetical protein
VEDNACTEQDKNNGQSDDISEDVSISSWSLPGNLPGKESVAIAFDVVQWRGLSFKVPREHISANHAWIE